MTTVEAARAVARGVVGKAVSSLMGNRETDIPVVAVALSRASSDPTAKAVS